MPPLSLDGRASTVQLQQGVGTPHAGAGPQHGSAAQLGGGGGGVTTVGSYPANITALAPPAMGTITTADAMASEGRIIEDAAMHEAYVRVITPEPAPTEETEEVRRCAGQGSWAAAGCPQACTRAGAAGGEPARGAGAASPPCVPLPLPPPVLPALQVCYMLRQSLDMRAKWLFRPQHSPEQLSHLPEAVRLSDLLGGDPFDWQTQVRRRLGRAWGGGGGGGTGLLVRRVPSGMCCAWLHECLCPCTPPRATHPPTHPQEVMPCEFEMHRGVMRVWADASREAEVFAPPGSAHEFFSGVGCCAAQAGRGLLQWRGRREAQPRLGRGARCTPRAAC